MEKYTTDKNNHYIQAAWTGTFWGEPKKKQRERYWKVYSFNIPNFLKYNEIPSFEELKTNKVVHGYASAEDFFKSDYVLYDNLDPDFANNCEFFYLLLKKFIIAFVHIKLLYYPKKEVKRILKKHLCQII